MKCPHCAIPLLMTERQGVEIDYCSQCRGVWLDRGELDKIIEYSARPVSSGQKSFIGKQHKREAHDYRDDREYSHHKKYKKKKGLSELFDFFD